MIRQLANGLVLRSLSEGFPSDRERLPDFYSVTNTEGETDHVKDGIRHWTRDLMNEHPTTTPEDIFVVVDPAKDDIIVSATLLIPQVWRYEDVPIPVGRPELVGTLHEYRKKGLSRALMEAVHERSAALGHELLGITGIQHFYRQFGYTMAVVLGQHSIFHLSALAENAPDYVPKFTLRPATPDDIPSIMEWREVFARERLLSDVYSAESLRYEISGRHATFYPHTVYQVIVNAEGAGVGYIALLDSVAEVYELRCAAYVVGNQASYLSTFYDVMAAIKRWAAETYPAPPGMLAFEGCVHDTVLRMIEYSPGGQVLPRPYGWYLRVPDLGRFFTRIAPVLERRLENSGAHRFSGELKIGFYDLKGISLKFEEGRLAAVAPIEGISGYEAQFSWNFFLNVVFGAHTLDELTAVLPDIGASGRAAALFEILFPKKKSYLIGLA